MIWFDIEYILPSWISFRNDNRAFVIVQQKPCYRALLLMQLLLEFYSCNVSIYSYFTEIEYNFKMSVNVIIVRLAIITRFIVIFHSRKCTFDALLALFYFVSSMHSKAIKSLLKFKKIICSLTIRLHSIPIWKLRKEKRPSGFSKQPVIMCNSESCINMYLSIFQ